MKIREATQHDWKGIVEIYNQAIADGFSTAEMDSITIDGKQDWFKQHTPGEYPIYVAEEEGRVLGWCSLSPYRLGRRALRRVAEISYYVDRASRRKGIATRLIEHAISAAPQLGLKSLIAILLDVNSVSVKALEKFRFERWGHMPGIADFDGRICGQFIYGRRV